MMKRREGFEAIKAAVAENAEYVAFIEAEIARIDARNDKVKAKRAAKTDAAGEDIRAKVIATLRTYNRAITLAEMVAAVGEPSGKVVYHIRPLVEDGVIVKEKAKVGDRKIMTYAIAPDKEADAEVEGE